jgi:hypothetical protein
MKNTQKSMQKKEKSTETPKNGPSLGVRLMCWFLAGVMVLGLAYSAIATILTLTGVIS